MLDVVDLNGSGAATLESFYVDFKHKWRARTGNEDNTFSHLVQTMMY